MATIIQRGEKGTSWIKYRVNGKQVYNSLNTTHRRVAEKFKRQVEAESDRGDLLAPHGRRWSSSWKASSPS